MEFRILGTVEVVDEAGCAVGLGPAKQRALLALLLLHVNEVVSRDRLIEELWGDRVPGTAATAHGYVSGLRKALEQTAPGRRMLLTRAPGYLLELDPDRIDFKRFELLARQGKGELVNNDAQSAAATLGEALSLWRGPPLAEFDSAPFALAARLRLEELRLAALEDRIDADLELGYHADLIGELETLVAEHPFRERLPRQLMLALYRSARQADALAAYQAARRTLLEELGLEPSRELQDLERAILTHDPVLDAPRPRPPPTRDGVGSRERRTTLAWRSPLGRKAALSAGLLIVAIALALAFALGRAHVASLRLSPDAVGFIDAKSDDVTRAFPVGRLPAALTLAHDSVWVANYEDETVTRINRSTGTPLTIAVRGHPTGITAFRGRVWVWTLEGSLVAVDPRYETAGAPISLAAKIVGTRSPGGQISIGNGHLWIAAPLATLIRVDAADGRNPHAILPDGGVQGAIDYQDGELWVAGEAGVFPISTETGASGAGIELGVVRDLAFGAGSLWVVSGGPGHRGGIGQALRRIDPETGIPIATIPVGNDPVSVAAAAGSIWVAARSDRMVERVDPVSNSVVARILVAGEPIALIPDNGGVWVTTGGG
jgi:DNA-binding SARP family transcriptional activator/streptogramin lyase